MSIRDGKIFAVGKFPEIFRALLLQFYSIEGYNNRQINKGEHGMSEEYGANFITVTDDDGNEFELEHLDTIEYNGQTYLAFFPAEHEGEEAQNEEELGLVILKTVLENGEEILSTLDSDEEIDAVYNEFMKELFSEDEEE